DITALGFNVAALNTCVNMPNFTISMKHTTVTALTTSFDNVGLEVVFTLPTFLPVVGWNTHTFDTPFTWNGTSNILIDICTTLIPGAYTQNASVYYTPTTGTNTCARYQSDTNPACLTTSTATVSVNRANMQITGEEMLNPPPGMPYGEIPANGTTDVPINGDITWTFGNNTDNYDLWFGPSGNMVKVVDNQPAGATGLYTYSNLSYATGYNWKVVAINANGTTSGPVWGFSTLCGTITQLPWNEGFETATTPALPACWFEENGDWVTATNSSSTYDADAHTGVQFLRESWNATNEYVWTPGFAVDAGTSYDFSFWWAGDNYSGWTGDVFYNSSQISTGATQLGGSFVVGTTVTTKTYEQVKHTLVATETGTLYFSIRVNCPTSTPWYLSFDDFRFEVTPTCPQPVDLGATFIAATSADLLWTSFSGLSDIEFGEAGFPPTGIPTYSGVVSPFSVSGLTSVTDYSFYVRDDCGGGDLSFWSGPYTFTTQPSCPQPFDLGIANLTMTSADLIWVSFSGLSDVEFGPSGFTPTGIPTYPGVTSPYNVSGLNSAAPYDFYVRDDCGGGDYSFWSGPFTFLTSPGSQTIPVFEGFENGFVYFNNASGNPANWTINTSYYHSGAQCAIDVYGNSQTNILHETGVLDLSGATVVWLDFWQIAKCEGDYDHCYVEISVDAGATYTPLPQETYTGTGIYVPALYNSPSGPCFDEDSYTIWGTGAEIPDNSTWWQQETFDLSDYLTTNVRIRFRLHTDASVIRYGWLLDDIFIYEPAYGTLAGTVTNAANSNPVEGATVTVGLLTTLSGADGTYNLPGVLTGIWDAVCSKTGFNPVTASVTIIEDQTTTQDFVLTEPAFVVAPLVITDTLEPNQLLDDYVNLSNPGLGTVDWTAGVVVTGDKGTDDLFDLLFDWPVGVGGGEAGIECDGNYIYTTKWNGSEFYRYELNGTYVETFACGAAGAIRDLAYNGTYFYGAAAATTVFEMDFATQTVVSSFTAPIAVRAIAYNEDEDIFYANNWSDAITMFNTAGANLGNFPCGPIGTDYYGFAYDGYSDGSPYLWGYAQTGTTLNELVQIQLPSGGETGVQFDVGSVAAVGTGIAGGLAITDAPVPGLYVLLGTSQNVDIWGLELCLAGPEWLTIEPNGGTLGAGINEDMTLHFNATDLLPGIYEAEIHFTTDPNVGSPIVEVTMVVEGLIPPINLDLTYECTDVILNWEMPTGGTPDSWNIYRDGTLLGNSTTMTYTDEMVMTETEYGYFIKAVYAGEESMPTATQYITVPVPADLEVPFIDGSASGNSATIIWDAPTGCLTPDGYNLYRDGSLVNTSLITELTYTDSGLESGFYEYYVTAVYYFGESDPSDPTYVLIVGIEETSAAYMQLYPNPASAMLNIHSDYMITQICVFNNSGKRILKSEIDDHDHILNLSELDCGVYFLHATTTKGNVIRKITVK
ncbi:MAG: T9SS type A sorting domain-containing protein, partial [Bacteroidetes bacterium]|nr:T9SS type A sorting domain-containing protein [Bacteroidota bacterium]